MTEYQHDYGTICHAAAALAVASCHMVNADKTQGGLTGFQSGAIMWNFIQHWMEMGDQPLKLLRYGNMLYPQYKEDYTSIDPKVFEWLQKEAARLLEDKTPASEKVTKHWQSIVKGKVPFGFKIKE